MVRLSVFLSHYDPVGRSAVCDCGISWLYSLFDGNDFVIEQWEGMGDNFKFKWLCFVNQVINQRRYYHLPKSEY